MEDRKNMNIEKVSMSAYKVLGFIETLDLKADEKIAVLDTASATVRATLQAETMRVMLANIIQGK